jgi:hypothetical protein
VGNVSDGLKVIMFEQKADVLEKRLGFRVQEYGLRQVFRRIPNHPTLAGLDTENLRDWRGEATILPPRVDSTSGSKGYPFTMWCGIEVSRAWRAGCYGNVASVLIEKPAAGDFLPIVDGGFNLQYSLLMQYSEGKGMILFCQMDVTGRSEDEPAAMQLVTNILEYVDDYSPSQRRSVLYAGDRAGQTHLERIGISTGEFDVGILTPDQVLVIGPGGDTQLASHESDIAKWLRKGGHILAVGLNEQEARVFLPLNITMKKEEHISAYFDPAGMKSPLAGISPAEVQIRDPRELPLVTDGADVIDNGVLAVSDDANVVFCQLTPWQFDHENLYHVKMTFRRTSFLLTRLLANMGSSGTTQLLSHFSTPVSEFTGANGNGRWLSGLYLDKPVEMDDPYRFFRW